MTNKTNKIARIGIISAIYCILTLALGSISYGPIQFRISEILMFLPLLSKDYIISLTLGCFLANLIGPYGVPDIIFGTLATLISCILVYITPSIFGKGKYTLLIASIWPTIINALIIGWMLYKFVGLPFIISSLEVALGEFVVITIIGLPIFKIVNNRYGSIIKNLNN